MFEQEYINIIYNIYIYSDIYTIYMYHNNIMHALSIIECIFHTACMMYKYLHLIVLCMQANLMTESYIRMQRILHAPAHVYIMKVIQNAVILAGHSELFQDSYHQCLDQSIDS